MRPKLLLAVGLSIVASIATAEDRLIGFADVDITPPVGYRMSGYFFERASTGTHDPLHAKAVFLRSGDTQIALVTCDLIGLSRDISTKARQLIETETGIPAANICIAATHSHTGPLYAGALREHFHRRAIEHHGKDSWESIDYSSELVKKIAEAVKTAAKDARPGTFSTAVVEETSLSFNRRFHMKDGSVVFNPGRKNPNIVRVAGPIDPTVGVIRFSDADGRRVLAALTVFALHLDTTGGTEYSADYPYYLQESLKAKYGPGFHSLFAAGTCGDINHIDVSTMPPEKPTSPEPKRIGEALASKVMSALDSPVDRDKPQLAARSRTINVPKQSFTPGEITAAQDQMDKIGGRELSFLEQVRVTTIVDLQLYPEDTIPLEVQVFRLSNKTAIVCLPGEVFVELGLAIKAASPFENTLVMELCNDTPAYIPTKKGFAEGSYEIVNSRVVAGSGEQMVAAAAGLLQELKP